MKRGMKYILYKKINNIFFRIYGNKTVFTKINSQRLKQYNRSNVYIYTVRYILYFTKHNTYIILSCIILSSYVLCTLVLTYLSNLYYYADHYFAWFHL